MNSSYEFHGVPAIQIFTPDTLSVTQRRWHLSLQRPFPRSRPMEANFEDPAESPWTPLAWIKAQMPTRIDWKYWKSKNRESPSNSDLTCSLNGNYLPNWTAGGFIALELATCDEQLESSCESQSCIQNLIWQFNQDFLSFWVHDIQISTAAIVLCLLQGYELNVAPWNAGHTLTAPKFEPYHSSMGHLYPHSGRWQWWQWWHTNLSVTKDWHM